MTTLKLSLPIQCDNAGDCSDALVQKARRALGLDLMGRDGSLSIAHLPNRHIITVELRDTANRVSLSDLQRAFTSTDKPGFLARSGRYLVGLFRKIN
jgi:hypothetical protein